MRATTALTYGWKFNQSDAPGSESPGYDDSAWQTVRVPHDWAIAGPFDEQNDVTVTRVIEDEETTETRHTGRTGGLPHAGTAWYRLGFSLPPELADQRVRIEFDGVMSHSTVYCNGTKVGGWPYGYSSFTVDLTGVASGGENLLALRVDNPPAASRWYPGAGIYRHVRLVVTDPIAIAHWGSWITTPAVNQSEATVVVRTSVETSGRESDVNLETSLISPTGVVVASAATISLVSDETTIEQSFIVEEPELWSAATPVLYTARSVVRTKGAVCDEVSTAFGIRLVELTPDRGLLINGIPDTFKGVCLHHDLGPLGAAVNRSALARQLRLLAEMGCNAIRTSHNPPAPELLDLCDEMGFYVICEAFDEWRIAKNENAYHTLFDSWAERDLRAMIRRDRNHPSVVMWSIGNEVRDQELAEGRQTAAFLTGICHDEDPTRPTTAGFNDAQAAIDNGLAAAVDVPGWNYRPNDYPRFRQEHPRWPMYGSETASTVSSRGEYYLPADEEKPPLRDNHQINSFDLCTPSWATLPDQEFSALDENPTLMGEFVWTGFDYLGEPTPYQWPSRSSYFGIVDLAGIPKSRYWLYKSRWSDQPVLYLHPHWTWPGHEGLLLPVHCYTNHHTVELFVNGVSVGKREKSEKTLMNRHRLVWPGIPYEPGELKALGYDAEGNAVGETILRTAGAPSAINLSPDRMRIAGDGDDMAFITASVVDEAGVIVPAASHALEFQLTGPAEIVGVCNGDPTNLRPMNGSRMDLFHGECVLAVRSDVAGDGLARIVAATVDDRAAEEGRFRAQAECQVVVLPPIEGH